MKKIHLLSLAIFYFLMSGISLASSTPTDTTVIRKCTDFEITGDGRSGQWAKASWIILNQAGSNDPDYLTKVKVLYSQKGIYFLYSCADKRITSSMRADNLNLWEEDVVEAFLWTDEGFPVYFEYELSPFNFELPIMVPNNNGKFLGWLPWHYDGERKTRHATDVKGGTLVNGGSITCWTAEFFIPFNLLTPLSNVPPVAGTHWRANMYRIDYDKGEEMTFGWQKTSKTFHEYKKFGTFLFE
jgi:hypothetical protein